MNNGMGGSTVKLTGSQRAEAHPVLEPRLTEESDRYPDKPYLHPPWVTMAWFCGIKSVKKDKST